MSARREEMAGERESEEVSPEEEDFEEAVREAASVPAARGKSGLPEPRIIPSIPEVVDDFLRNFLRRTNLSRTLSSFEAEWYSSARKPPTATLTPGTPPTGTLFIPDALAHGRLLQSELERVRAETDLLRQEVLAAGESLARMQRERDFHRLQYRQVSEDKRRLLEDFKQLKKHLESYEPALRQLDDKYQAALRQKTLIGLEKDRVQNASDARLDREKAQIKKVRSIKRCDNTDKPPAKSPKTRHPKESEFPICSGHVDPHLAQARSGKWNNPRSFNLSCSLRAHKLPISCISLHPREAILASASDDRSWRLWALPADGEKARERRNELIRAETA